MSKDLAFDNLTATVPAHRTWPMFLDYLQKKQELFEEEHGVRFALADTLRMILVEQHDFGRLVGTDGKEVKKAVLAKTKNW